MPGEHVHGGMWAWHTGSIRRGKPRAVADAKGFRDGAVGHFAGHDIDRAGDGARLGEARELLEKMLAGRDLDEIDRATVERELAETLRIQHPEDPRAQALLRADVDLETLRLEWRLAHELRCVSTSQYKHGARLIDEVGKLLGAWRK